MYNDRYSQKKILVLGWAKSGKAVTELLLSLEAIVDVYSDQVIDNQIVGANYTEDVDVNEYDLIVKNPGINYRHVLLRQAVNANIPIVVEAQVALDLYQGKLIAITGSNGKTTLTTLVDQILTSAKVSHLTAGNIGTPVSTAVQTAKKGDLMILELSSFQLLGMPRIKPEIAIINNIFENHLDYHGSFAEYVQAKKMISQNQDQDDFLIVNQNQEITQQLIADTDAQIEYFSVIPEYIDLTQIKAIGKHNLENIAAAAKVAEMLNIDRNIIKTTVENFSGLNHRLEYLGNFKGMKVYNDSKATDIKATQVALDSFSQSTIWIAGGLDRDDDYMQLQDNLKNVEWIIAYGQTAPKISELAQEANIKFSSVDDLTSAVSLLNDKNYQEKILLFSPAAASWDQFENFEERGNLFKKLIKEQG